MADFLDEVARTRAVPEDLRDAALELERMVAHGVAPCG